MPSNRLVLTGDRGTIKVKRAPWLIIGSLSVVVFLCAIIPLFVVVFSVVEGFSSPMGIFVSSAMFWGAGFYFLRILLWNWHGQEEWSFGEDGIDYVANYVLFKGGRQRVSIEKLEVGTVHDESTGMDNGRVTICNVTERIDSVISLPITDCACFVQAVQAKYNLLAWRRENQ